MSNVFELWGTSRSDKRVSAQCRKYAPLLVSGWLAAVHKRRGLAPPTETVISTKSKRQLSLHHLDSVTPDSKRSNEGDPHERVIGPVYPDH